MPITWITVADRFAGADRLPALLRLLLQGFDHRGGAPRTTPGAGFAYFCVLAGVFVTASTPSACTSSPSTARSASAGAGHATMATPTPRTTQGHDRYDEAHEDAMADGHHGPAEAARVALGGDAAAGAAGDPSVIDRLLHDRPDAVRRLVRRRDLHRTRASGIKELAAGFHGAARHDGARTACRRCRSGWRWPVRRRPGSSTSCGPTCRRRSSRSPACRASSRNKYGFDRFNEMVLRRRRAPARPRPVEGRRPGLIDGWR
jgi:hypothetical protein